MNFKCQLHYTVLASVIGKTRNNCKRWDICLVTFWYWLYWTNRVHHSSHWWQKYLTIHGSSTFKIKCD